MMLCVMVDNEVEMEEVLMVDLEEDQGKNLLKLKEDKITEEEKKSSSKEKENDECPICGKQFKSLIQHLLRNKKCKVSDQEMKDEMDDDEDDGCDGVS